MRKLRVLTTSCLAAASVLLAGLPVARAADPERGKLLHGTFCQGCHNESVAKREPRVAKTYAELRGQVVRWQTNAGLKWQPEDINDVTAYLNAAYYGFKCEGPDC